MSQSFRSVRFDCASVGKDSHGSPTSSTGGHFQSVKFQHHGLQVRGSHVVRHKHVEEETCKSVKFRSVAISPTGMSVEGLGVEACHAGLVGDLLFLQNQHTHFAFIYFCPCPVGGAFVKP